jgi:hypothetical protein
LRKLGRGERKKRRQKEEMTVGFESAALHLEDADGSTSHRATSLSFLCKRTRGGKGKEKGNQRREESGSRPSVVRRSLDLAVAGGGGSPERSLRSPPPPVCCERCGGERKGLGFAGATSAAGFDRARSTAGRRITDPR